MNHKDQIYNFDHLLAVADLAVAIQNKGIATTFVDFSGHVSRTYIKLYFPKWEHGKSYDAEICLTHDDDPEVKDRYNREMNQKEIDRLKKILETGQCIDSQGNVVDVEAKQRNERKELYEQLKSEFEAA